MGLSARGAVSEPQGAAPSCASGGALELVPNGSGQAPHCLGRDATKAHRDLELEDMGPGSSLALGIFFICVLEALDGLLGFVYLVASFRPHFNRCSPLGLLGDSVSHSLWPAAAALAVYWRSHASLHVHQHLVDIPLAVFLDCRKYLVEPPPGWCTALGCSERPVGCSTRRSSRCCNWHCFPYEGLGGDGAAFPGSP